MDSRSIVRTVSLRNFKVRVEDIRELASLESSLVETLAGQIAFTREKKLSYTNLLASRHIKRGKASLSVDIRRSKTSLLKLPTIWRKYQEELRPRFIPSTLCSELDSSSCLTESNALLKSIANTRTASQSGLSKCLLIKCWIANSALVQFPLSR